MKKVGIFERSLTIDGFKTVFDLGSSRVRYMDSARIFDEEKVYVNWEDFYSDVKKGLIPHTNIVTTCFTEKEKNEVDINSFNIFDTYTITKKKFKKIRYESTFVEKKDEYSFSYLKSSLTAEEFIDYLKDNGISAVTV